MVRKDEVATGKIKGDMSWRVRIINQSVFSKLSSTSLK